jgi:hypothetical protein
MTVLRRFVFDSNVPDVSTERDAGWEILSDDDYRGSLKRIKENAALAESTPVWAEDLLRILRAAHLVDRHVSRAEADDGWSRNLELRVQVSDAERWNGVLPKLETLLTILTGDSWRLSASSGAHPIDAEPRLFGGWVADAVALFSGGLDSSAYAARHLAQNGGRLLLVSHNQANAHAPQELLLGHLKRLAVNPERLLRRPMSSEVRTKGRRLESSTRSRGLSYIGSAVFAAAAHRVSCVIVPENGQLAINPPISAARRGACSTRSVHPMVISLSNEVIRLVGGEVVLLNPFLSYTKGDVCRAAVEAGLGVAALRETVSCGSHTAQRGFGNCGYCFPCLIRRAGLQSALGHDPTRYAADLHEIAGKRGKPSQHLQDLRTWVAHEFTTRDLLADMPLPAELPIADALDVISRGRIEVRQMLAASLGSR